MEPDARVRNAASLGNLDGGLLFDGSRSVDTGVSWLYHRQGFMEYAKRYDPLTAKTMVSYLDRYVTVVRSPTDIIRVFNGLSAGQQHHLNRALRALFNYAEIMGSSKDWLDPLRKAIPKDKIGIDLRIPSEDGIKGDLPKIEGLLPKYQALWKVCLDSGIRLIEAIHLINSFDPQRLQPVNGFYRYQTGEFRGTKQSYFAYFTESSLRLIQDADGEELHRPDTSGYFSRQRLTQPKYLRKFAFDKMVELEVPESVADFIQGRVAMRVGARHYMSLARQADKFYAKYAEYLESLGGEAIQQGHAGVPMCGIRAKRGHNKAPIEDDNDTGEMEK